MEGGGEAQPQLQAEVTKVAVTQGKQWVHTGHILMATKSPQPWSRQEHG